MKITDTLHRPAGVLTLIAYDSAGAELWRDTGKNLIVGGGYFAALQALAGETGASIAKIGVGTNGTAATEADAQLTDPVAVDIQRVEYPSPTAVRFHFKIDYTDAVGMSICEFGLLTADGRLFSRKTRAAIDKTQYMSIVGMWDINI